MHGPYNIEFKKPFWLPTIATDPHVLGLVTIGLPKYRYTKLKIIISVLIMESYE
jgi:hypothetical protein